MHNQLIHLELRTASGVYAHMPADVPKVHGLRVRLRVWLEETHGSSFELLRHFVRGFFDSEMVSTPGEWLKVGIGLFAALLSAGILVLKMYTERYDNFASAALYQQGLRDDLLSFIAVAMALTALLTALQWQSLFPSLRDCLALASLPLRPRQIFQAKFTALLLVFTAYMLAVSIVPAMLFTAVVTGKWQENSSALVNIAANCAALAGSCAARTF